jgi:SRSO17 transposase
MERVFEDAKGQCGLADYQVQGWLAWHHHVTMVMLAMLFMSCTRFLWTPICPRRDRNDDVQHEADRRSFGR